MPKASIVKERHFKVIPWHYDYRLDEAQDWFHAFIHFHKLLVGQARVIVEQQKNAVQKALDTLNLALQSRNYFIRAVAKGATTTVTVPKLYRMQGIDIVAAIDIDGLFFSKSIVNWIFIWSITLIIDTVKIIRSKRFVSTKCLCNFLNFCIQNISIVNVYVGYLKPKTQVLVKTSMIFVYISLTPVYIIPNTKKPFNWEFYFIRGTQSITTTWRSRQVEPLKP